MPPENASPAAMTPTERRASASLGAIFALRMLGLFLVLPVFALEARRLPGGGDAAYVGLAMGVYGLTQGCLQFAYGLASDRFGRKRVIVAGLAVFALGSVVAALADSVTGLLVGRAIQGAGAVSAAVTALLADLTRDAVRTKAMAIIGASIGLTFAASLVLGPLLNNWGGLAGIFALTAVLAVAGMAVVLRGVPPEPEHAIAEPRPPGQLAAVLRDPALLRMNLGVFVLHAVQLSMWVAVPLMLVRAGVARERHWLIYLPAVLLSFAVMGASLFRLERGGHLRTVFLGSIALAALVQAGFWFASGAPGAWLIGVLLFLFFCSFNVLEASQPSLTSRLAPAGARGAALGVYNTCQSLGLFAGGLVGGTLYQSGGPALLFGACGLALLLWLAIAWPMRVPGRAGAAAHS